MCSFKKNAASVSLLARGSRRRCFEEKRCGGGGGGVPLMQQQMIIKAANFPSGLWGELIRRRRGGADNAACWGDNS